MNRYRVFCTARDEARATRLLDVLKGAGFSEARISLLVPETAIPGGFAPAAPASDGETSKTTRIDPKVLAGALESLLEAGVLAAPGLGRLIGAGPLIAELNLARSFDAAENAIRGLEAAGIPVAQVELYQRSLRTGKILLSIDCDNREEGLRNETVLAQAGADDIVVCASGGDPHIHEAGIRHQRAA